MNFGEPDDHLKHSKADVILCFFGYNEALRGPNGLDGFRKDLDGHVDTIAERAVQLGGTALGTSQVVAADSKLAAYPTDIYTTKDHLAALIDRFAETGKAARAAIDEADEAGDADTADIFTAYSRTLDKSLWFLEAHTQEKE